MYKNCPLLNEYTPFMQSQLAKAEHWHIDGSFYVAPNSLYQL